MTEKQQAVNLFDQITEILTKKGHTQPIKWQKGVDVKNISKLPFEFQRKLINQHLRLVLGASSMDTARERYCLIDGGDVEQWVTIFEREIADTMVQYTL